jgi:superfamily II DNA/RNA helicase
MTKTEKNCHIAVTTLAKFIGVATRVRNKLDFTKIKCIVIDEADSFFIEKTKFDDIMFVDALIKRFCLHNVQ